MILGIDASNIRGGGGVTHLVELLRAANPKNYGFEKVIVWAGSKTLAKLENKDWLEKCSDPILDKSLPYRIFWQKFLLSRRAGEKKCHLLFIPGGSYSGSFRNIISMSQNLLPFDWKELRRYGLSYTMFKFLLLRYTQSSTFKRSLGVIFLTRNARKKVLEQFPMPLDKTAIVNHGINNRFFFTREETRDFDDFTWQWPAKILYVSFVGKYKHQWNVIDAISKLLDKGIPVELTLVGDLTESSASRKVEVALLQNNKWSRNIHHHQNVTYDAINRLYQDADLFLFASTCETFGQIVTEAMASGLPIVSSDNAVLREILQNSALYFDAENIDSIAEITEKLLRDTESRRAFSTQLQLRARDFSWEKCASETFFFFQRTAKKINAK